MIVITDLLKTPFDEGAKIATLNLTRYLKEINGDTIVSINGDTSLSFVDDSSDLNKLLFDLSFYKKIKNHSSNKVLYIPEASITLASFIRAKLINAFTGKDIYILSFQIRRYSAIIKIIIRAIQPKCIFTQSSNTAKYLSEIGINNKVLPLGVDDEKYYEFDPATKKQLRSKYNISHNKTVLLHVGHIQKSRNLEWLLQVKDKLPNIEIIIVGSSYNKNDKALYKKLADQDIIIINEYTRDIEKIYNISDYYVFPVIKNAGAIETPLSVLEAMACNLSVIATRFGSLHDLFDEDKYFHFVNSTDEIINLLKNGKGSKCNNRSKVKLFAWSEVASQLVEIAR